MLTRVAKGTSFRKADDGVSRDPLEPRPDTADQEAILSGELIDVMREVAKSFSEDQIRDMLLGGSFDALFALSDLMDNLRVAGRLANAIEAAARATGRPALERDINQWRRLTARAQRTGAGVLVETGDPARLTTMVISPEMMPTGAINMSFDILDQHVIRYSERRGAELVVEIAEEMRRVIRAEVVRASSGQLTAQQLKRRLAKVIPLHTRYATAVSKMEERLYVEYIRGGMDATRAAGNASRRAGKYAAKLTRQRAQTIARTEIMISSNEGQFMGHKVAQNNGLLSATAVKEWVTAEDEDVCPVCGPLHATTVALDTVFPTGRLTPPAHPNCRCSYNVIDDVYAGLEERYGEGWL